MTNPHDGRRTGHIDWEREAEKEAEIVSRHLSEEEFMDLWAEHDAQEEEQ